MVQLSQWLLKCPYHRLKYNLFPHMNPKHWKFVQLLHYHCAIVALSSCSCCTIIVQLLHYHCAIVALSLCSCCTIIVQLLHCHCAVVALSLCSCCTIIVQLLHYHCAVVALSSHNQVANCQFLPKIHLHMPVLPNVKDLLVTIHKASVPCIPVWLTFNVTKGSQMFPWPSML